MFSNRSLTLTADEGVGSRSEPTEGSVGEGDTDFV